MFVVDGGRVPFDERRRWGWGVVEEMGLGDVLVGFGRRWWGRFWVAVGASERRLGRACPLAARIRVLSAASCALGAGKGTAAKVGMLWCCGTSSWPDRFLVGG